MNALLQETPQTASAAPLVGTNDAIDFVTNAAERLTHQRPTLSICTRHDELSAVSFEKFASIPLLTFAEEQAFLQACAERRETQAARMNDLAAKIQAAVNTPLE